VPKPSLYDLAHFRKLVENGEWGYLNERRPKRTRDKLDWTDEDVSEFLCGITEQSYTKTVQNRRVTDFPGHEFVDADQYEVHWDEANKISRGQATSQTITFSVKIAIVEDAEGQVAGVVTFHLSNEP